MKAICTIITKSHIAYAIALQKSVQRFIKDIRMHVLIVDSFDKNELVSDDKIHFYSVESIKESEIGNKIYKKYYQRNMDHFRWSAKPVFMNYLLNQGIDYLLYLDSDLYFFDNPDFLFEKLNQNSVLLSPHFRTSNPSIDYEDYGRNNTHGLFNGGFVGANKNGIAALEWWADTCEKKCVKDRKHGYYVDQSHLSLIPILYENVEIIKNRGCNVASWNRNTCHRSIVNEKLVLAGKDDLVFVHFTNDTIRGILDGSDPLLLPYLAEYADAMKTSDPSIDILQKFMPNYLDRLVRPSVSNNIRKQIHLIRSKF